MDRNIHYTHGHYCEPNGVGDWRLICPEKGVHPNFVPYFYAAELKGKCICGKHIEPAERDSV